MCAIPGLIGLGIGLLIAAVGIIVASGISSRKGFQKGFEERKKKAEAEIGSAEQEAKRILSEAQKNAEGKKREVLLEAKEEIHKSRVELDREIKDRRNEIQRQERRLVQKEETLDKKVEALEQKDEVLNKKTKEIQDLHDKTIEHQKQQLVELERISGMSVEEIGRAHV